MLIEKELIVQAKETLGEEAVNIIVNDLKLENFDEKNLKANCPFHSESTASFIWNPKDNCFKCFGCGKVYGIIDHYVTFYNLTFLGAVEKLFDKTKTKFSFGERGVKKIRDYKYPNYEPSHDRSKVEEYCKLRGISKETLDYCDVKQSKTGLLMWNFYDENDVLLTVKCRHPRKIEKSEMKEWYLPNFDNTPILFNMNKVDHTNKTVVITEGQFDTLAIIECGYTNCVSVPGGSENMKWIETCFDWLEQFEKIIIWSDNDDAGLKMRREAVSRLGNWRCLYVDLPKKIEYAGQTISVKDANELLVKTNKQTVLDYIENAQEMPITGVVDLSQVDDFDIEKAPGLYTGLESVKNIVYKFLFGSVMVVTGQRGAGKSTLLNQMFICQPLHQGYDVFCFSGELAPPVLKSWIELTMAGPEHAKLKEGNDFVHIIEPEAKKKMREWYEGRIWIYNQVSQKAKDIFDKAIAVTRKYGVKVWILDNLTTIDIDANDTNSNQKQKDFMVELIHLAALYGVFIVLVIHPRKIMNGQELSNNDVAGSSSLTDLAQYVMSIKRFSKREKEGEKDNKGFFKKGKEPIDEDVEMNVMKNRYTGRIGEARLYFDYSSYRFYNKLSELWERLMWDKNNPNPLKMIDPRDKNMPENMRN